MYINNQQQKKNQAQDLLENNFRQRVKQDNAIKRKHQIAALFDLICINHPVRIDTSKIIQPINSINLGWILAICRMSYYSFKVVDFKNSTLDSMAYNMIKKIHSQITNPNQWTHQYVDFPKYSDEYDLPTLSTVDQILSYNLRPEAVIEIISNDPICREFVIKNELKKPTTPLHPPFMTTRKLTCDFLRVTETPPYKIKRR